MCPLVCLLVTAGMLFAADDPKTAPSEQEKLQGTWVSESGELEGRKMPAEEGTTHRFTFEGDKLTIYRGDRGREAKYKIDPNKKPMELTYRLSESDEERKGIYSWDGEKLKICAGNPGTERPKEMSTKRNDGYWLLVLKREKPAK